MRYLSVCSGIEAATQAWHPLGWTPAAFSEIEPFPSAVLDHHYPHVPNVGDMTKHKDWSIGAIDLLVGGTPCQSFSVAGLRKGMADPRGNLALTYLAIAERNRPRWIVWENVPGVLSSNGGRDFGAFLGGLGQLGYGFAYRVLDAQFVRTCGQPFAVPQRRRRVFVVGYLGDWRRAAAVLFDRESLSGHSAPRREAGQAVAALTANGVGTCGADDNQGQAGHLISSEVSRALTACKTATGRLDPNEQEFIVQPIAFSSKDFGGDATVNLSPTLRACGHTDSHANAGAPPAVAFDIRGREGGAMPEGPHDTANIRAASGGSSCSYVPQPWAVRRLTPVECERLQAFPDNFTRIPYRGKPADKCPDGPRYKALGNSMAVNVMAYIGERIKIVEELT